MPSTQSKAKKKYAAKYHSPTIGTRFEQSKAVALRYQGEYIGSLFDLKKKVYAVLSGSALSSADLLAYFYFGEAIVKLRKKSSGLPLYLEAALAKFKWTQRGLDGSKLNAVLRVCGVMPQNLPIFAGGAGGDVNVAQWGGVGLSGADITVLLQHLNADISTLATESTLAAIKSKTDNLDAALSTFDFATETTLGDIKALLPAALDSGALKIREQNPLTSLAVNVISGFALESGGNLDAIEADMDSIVTLLAGGLPAALDGLSLKVKEQNPLSSIAVNVISGFALESGGNLATLAGKDFATQTTLASIKTGTDFLSEIAGDTDSLATIAGKDFATETTLAAMKALLPTALDTGALKVREQNPLSTIAITPPTAIGTISDLTGNSAAQQIIAASTPCKAVVVRALAGNASVCRVGDGNVSASRGAELSGGDSLMLAVNNVNLVYFYGVSPDKVSVTYVN